MKDTVNGNAPAGQCTRRRVCRPPSETVDRPQVLTGSLGALRGAIDDGFRGLKLHEIKLSSVRAARRYLEEDGILLSISLLAAAVVLAVDLRLVWDVLHGAKPIRLSV